jgi:hypothetical protein
MQPHMLSIFTVQVSGWCQTIRGQEEESLQEIAFLQVSFKTIRKGG